MSHLMRGSVLLSAARGRLFVVLASVHHLSLGALSDQVSAHARNIFEAMTWWRRRGGKKRQGEMCSRMADHWEMTLSLKHPQMLILTTTNIYN